ncbi:P1 family peptidase [Mycolicibacterium fallax]|uniref:Uncharacterized protein n=1 Tax=Mycolicibacterium fallax TaxID=1793 RepID=A0A1X1RHZ8_MYCFA|nr:P1 family peptidase [Mycolicibacterium fallax]ORV06641.1 hypothetical protein AWC04_04055 [Mycolicibacterium fallax]BBY96585.1 hypothetical protein MFAL_00520 [Mycolicibacterium fallax]
MNRHGSITDVAGILVGQHHWLDDDATLGTGWASGTTVLLTPPNTVGGVDCRGGAPGTRETELLDPANSVQYVDAIALCGGSAYGLAAADGIMNWLESQGRGVAMSGGLVPIVPAAVIFDLPVGAWSSRPTADFGYAAARSAGTEVAVGTAGAGTGARSGVLKGGVGTASVRLGGRYDGVTVGALAIVNSAGSVIDPDTGLPWMADAVRRFGLRTPPPDQVAAFAARDAEHNPLNTTIAVVATDAALSPAGCRRMAIAAHDGLAHAIRPAHTPVDGDTVFALSTGAVRVPPDPQTPPQMSAETPLLAAVGAAAAEALATAVLVGVFAASTVADIPTYRDLLPGAFA